MNYSYSISLSFPAHIPKEATKKEISILFRRQKIYCAIVSLGFAITLAILIAMVFPKLQSLYADVNTDLPYLSQKAPYIAAGLVSLLLLFTYRSVTSTDSEDLKQKLNQYSDTDLIKTSGLINTSQERIVMILGGISVGFIVISIILPIYNLTNSI